MLACVLALAAGCSRLDFTRETVHNPLTDVLDSGEPYVRSASDEQARQERLEAMLSRVQAGKTGQEKDYRICPGDTVHITVFALEKPDQNSEFDRVVPQDGTISLPWLDHLQAAGLSVRQFEDSVRKAYDGRYLKNPQVTVAVSEYRGVAVVVTGAVRNPGVYYQKENTSTVLEMIVQAGGLSDEAGDEVLIVRPQPATPRIALKDGVTGAATNAVDGQEDLLADGEAIIPIDLRQLVDEGDLRLNMEIQAGDIVTVRSGARRFFYVLGYVRAPGAFEIRGGQRLDALRAIARAGGLAQLGRAENSVLLREADGRQEAVTVDVIKMAKGVRPLVYLEAGDTLIVGTSFLGRLSEIVRPTVGLGASAAYSTVP
ncbi:MAG: polysaccharide biosynthesis/export family protein [Phycisphaerae bacterium]|nr:polysaccharide biosynthesis/export family protein [Phycisphaerae bacterium]